MPIVAHSLIRLRLLRKKRYIAYPEGKGSHARNDIKALLYQLYWNGVHIRVTQLGKNLEVGGHYILKYEGLNL